MSALKYLLAIAVSLAITLPLKADADNINLVLAGAPPAVVLNLYEKLSGKPVTVTEEVAAIDNDISLQIENQKKDAALKIIEEALAKQAGIEIVHEKDGSQSARKLKRG